MSTITITSQGQITIPAAIRRAWNVQGADQLRVDFDPETQRMVIEKPITIDEFITRVDKIIAKKPNHIKPLPADKIHELYEIERTKEIIAKLKGNQ